MRTAIAMLRVQESSIKLGSVCAAFAALFCAISLVAQRVAFSKLPNELAVYESLAFHLSVLASIGCAVLSYFVLWHTGKRLERYSLWLARVGMTAAFISATVSLVGDLCLLAEISGDMAQNRHTALYDNLNSFFLFVLCFSTIIANLFFGSLAIQEPRSIMGGIFLLGIPVSILSIAAFRSEFEVVTILLHPLYEVVKLASIAVWLGLPERKIQAIADEKYRTERTCDLATPGSDTGRSV